MEGSRVDREEEIRALAAADVFLGLNFKSQNLCEGLQLARSCRHELAQWLVSVFPDRPPATPTEAKAVLLAAAEAGPRGRALCFAALVGPPDAALVRKAAAAGDAQAQGWLAGATVGPEAALWAARSSAQGHRAGLFAAGAQAWARAPGESEEARRLFRAAAERGYVRGMYEHGRLCAADWERFRWWGRAAAQGLQSARQRLAEEAPGQLRLWSGDARRARAVYELGAALAGDRAAEAGCGDAQREAAAHCVALYRAWTQEARDALWCWMLVARRIRVVRDVARLIAQLAWSDREVWAEARITE